MKSLLISAVIKIAIKTGIRYFLAKSKRSEKKASKWKSGCLLIVIILFIPSFISIVFNSEPRTVSYYVTSPNPYVRACPSTACSDIGGLVRGDRIQVLGRVVGEKPEGKDYSSHTWVKFKYNDTVAYIYSSLVSTKKPNQ